MQLVHLYTLWFICLKGVWHTWKQMPGLDCWDMGHCQREQEGGEERERKREIRPGRSSPRRLRVLLQRYTRMCSRSLAPVYEYRGVLLLIDGLRGWFQSVWGANLSSPSLPPPMPDIAESISDNSRYRSSHAYLHVYHKIYWSQPTEDLSVELLPVPDYL